MVRPSWWLWLTLPRFASWKNEGKVLELPPLQLWPVQTFPDLSGLNKGSEASWRGALLITHSSLPERTGADVFSLDSFGSSQAIGLPV